MSESRPVRLLPSRPDGLRTLLVVTIDTEEEGRWGGGYPRHGGTCRNVAEIRSLVPLFQEFGIRPTWLVDYPVTQDAAAVAALVKMQEICPGEIGAHLHPWCTPPFGRGDELGLTYVGLLPPEEQRAKLETLTEALERASGCRPVTYRAGRWGLSASTIPVLESLGYWIDSSVTPLRWETGRGGPSFLSAPTFPYTLGRGSVVTPGRGQVLEIPATLGFVGPLGPILEPLVRHLPPARGLGRVLETLGRVWLRPSSHGEKTLRRAASTWRRRAWPVLNVMFHSSELLPGASPYVQDESDRRRFLRRLRGIFEEVLGHPDTAAVTLQEAGHRLQRSANGSDLA